MTDDEISEILLPLMPLKDPYVFARAIAAAEREACAKVCDEQRGPANGTYSEAFNDGCHDCAIAIRVRSNAGGEATGASLCARSPRP